MILICLIGANEYLRFCAPIDKSNYISSSRNETYLT